MDVIKKISLQALAERFGQSFRRFPIAMSLCILLGLFLVFLNHQGKVSDRLEFFLLFYPATGAVLAIALSLLTEDFKHRAMAIAVQVVCHAVWLTVSVYLSQFDRFSAPMMIAVAATVVSIGLAVFLVCFYRWGQDMAFWNFSIHTASYFFIAAAIGVVISMGLVLLIASMKMLFDINLEWAYGDVWAVIMVILAPALFMNLVPKGAGKYNDVGPRFTRFSRGVLQFLLMPLLGLYLLTLYAYVAKILLQWELPVGGVSYLVTGSMVMMILLIYLSYPLLREQPKAAVCRILQWLPVAMLPLLALMTVAVGRRLSDYGITVSRLYLLVFNVWCYAVCLWLIATRCKRIWAIPALFAIVLLLISVGPQSIANITIKRLKSEVRSTFIASGIKQFPLSDKQYARWLDQTDGKRSAAIDSKLNYLKYHLDVNLQDLIQPDVVVGSVSIANDEVIVDDKFGKNYNFHYLMENVSAPVPQGFTHMMMIDRSYYDIPVGDDNTIDVELMVNDNSMTFKLNVQDLITKADDGKAAKAAEPLIVQGNGAALVVDSYNLSLKRDDDNKRLVSSMYLSGLLFSKRPLE